MTRRLTTGYYWPTKEFRAISEHVAVMDADTQLLVATTGRAFDRESEADARLFAEADNLLQLLRDAPVGVATSGDRITKWLERRDAIIERIEKP